ncbi:hypothetical protein V1512DRAFT_267544 [Lipomyces arxii]|uniref:uncharacterized protein n=1 Tax=Lipomyces arxii TaxID=56418 RepID=UPI0034CF2521
MIEESFDPDTDCRLEKVSLDDVSDHIFWTYSKCKPRDMQNLGYISRTSHTLPVSIKLQPEFILQAKLGAGVSSPTTDSGRRHRRTFRSQSSEGGTLEFDISQSLELLNSASESSTTGAVLWQVSPLFAEWVLAPKSVFYNLFVGGNVNVIELGAGTSGVLASAFSLFMFLSQSGLYVATDQEHLLPLLRKNVKRNLGSVRQTIEQITHASDPPLYNSLTMQEDLRTLPTKSLHRKQRQTPARQQQPQCPQIEVLELDWERARSSTAYIRSVLYPNTDETDEFDIVIACDTVYNDFLVPPFVETLNTVASNRTHILIAMQMRSHEVQEEFLTEALSNDLNVWYVLPEHLSDSMKEGFAIYYIRKNINT